MSQVYVLAEEIMARSATMVQEPPVIWLPAGTKVTILLAEPIPMVQVLESPKQALIGEIYDLASSKDQQHFKRSRG